MQHARPDYQRIQDPSGLIPEDEPVFLLRAQDRTAGVIVYLWAAFNEYVGGDPDLIRMAKDQAMKMQKWRTRKVADYVKVEQIPPSSKESETESPEVTNALNQCERIQERCEEIPEAGEDFAMSVSEKVASIALTIEERNHVTDAQQTALDNMESGLDKWFR